MKNELIALIAPSLITAVVTMLSTVTSFAVLELKKFVATKTKNEKTRHAFDVIADAVDTTVDKLEQTAVAKMKEASETGKLSTLQIGILKQEALSTVLRTVTGEVAGGIGLGAMDLERFIAGKIEQAVFKRKLEVSVK